MKARNAKTNEEFRAINEINKLSSIIGGVVIQINQEQVQNY